MSATVREHPPVLGTPAEREHLPELARSYLARSLPAGGQVPATVRVQQSGEMRQRPGGRIMPFRATEDFSIDRVAFSWRARFPIVGPLAVRSSTNSPTARAGFVSRSSASHSRR